MYTSFTDWESGLWLMHHGIKGQKWGVRRFQNEDGSLTEAGRKRVAQSGAYMDIDRKRSTKRIGRISDENRDAIYQKYQDTYWKNHDRMHQTGNIHSLSSEHKKLWNSLKDKYASATLKDLKYKDTSKARRDVKAVLMSISADWNNQDPSWNDYLKAQSQRSELMHPKRTKIKKAMHKVKSVLDTATSAKKLIT